MTQVYIQSLAINKAKTFGIDPVLVCALIMNESSWNPFAMRFEPRYYQLHTIFLKLLTETEKVSRACSWGLMQVLGQTAREYGFGRDYLSELCDPDIGTDFGCQKLQRCLGEHNGVIRDALLAYNGGADLAYPDRVMRYYDRYKGIV
jgi:soluble lytic murein transglycosylase-like protein